MGIRRAGRILETKAERFAIKEIKNKSNGTAQIVVSLGMKALKGKSFWHFESVEQVIEVTLRLIFAGTRWTK